MADDQAKPKDPDSGKVVLELAVREYIDENDRLKLIDSKTGPMITATGAALLVVAGMMAKPPGSLSLFWQGAYLIGIGIVLLCLASALVFFLRTLWVRDYTRLPLGNIVDDLMMTTEADSLRVQLASSYRKAVETNTTSTNRKSESYQIGLLLVSLAVILLAMLLIGATALMHP